MGDLLAQIAAAGGAISGLMWELDPSNSAHDQARSQAGQDARRRAQSYADALGLRLGAVAWVAEPGLRSPGDHLPRSMAFAAAARAGGEAADETIEVTPEEITITAAVEVGFALINE